jgi:hypothetical protein
MSERKNFLPNNKGMEMETQQNEKQVKFSITVYVHGVKKKCRKSERHSLKLGSIDWNEGSFDKEAVSQRARDIGATNMKSTSGRIQVQMLRVEFKKENGFTSTSFMMFDERHVNFNVDTQLNEALE